MPDWFYRTAAQRALFAFPDALGRAIALGTIGLLGRSAPGRACIDFLGHMRPPECLRVNRAGLTFSSPLGLGRRIDPDARALDGLARFGVGFLETGPVDVGASGRPDQRLTRAADATLRLPADEKPGGLDWWRDRLARRRTRFVPLFVRVRATNAAEVQRVADGLAEFCDAFVIEPRGSAIPLAATCRPCLLAIDFDSTDLRAALLAARDTGYAGIALDAEARLAEGVRRIGLANAAEFSAMLERVRLAREILGADSLVIVTQAVRQPDDARRLFEAGADLLQVDTGLLFTGPGLTKRCNEALEASRGVSSATEARRDATGSAWFWTSALGAAMVAGGLLALIVAMGRVVLPYDEHYLGLTREMLRALNPRLLDFMAHDRVSLAGTMIGIGVLYATLAWTGIRRGAHWAQVAIGASGLTGFLSFFSFLGFGYFDPFHAFVSATLLPLTLLGLALPRGGGPPEVLPPEWTEGPGWRRAQWGQLLFVVHAVGLLGAGATILAIGMTDVFVAEDLAFLCMSPADLIGINEHVIPVVAHDRASLGGMLLANGVGLLLATLWGFRRGRRSLWWAMLGTGLPAYVAAIGIHLQVGYVDWRHLLPASLGAGLFAGGLLLTKRYLVPPSASGEA